MSAGLPEQLGSWASRYWPLLSAAIGLLVTIVLAVWKIARFVARLEGLEPTMETVGKGLEDNTEEIRKLEGRVDALEQIRQEIVRLQLLVSELQARSAVQERDRAVGGKPRVSLRR